ncbi:hypothetical protein ACFODZ_05775 [Marinicella sediminis]|uniref:7(1) septoil knot domain-containing protein n=1 Tax=Marinicella sediminis TaxID=1792834 RepID=A0ABV7J9A5_9GAMM|nr:hypothetical protein [Marinicella sediminis]
MNKDLKIAAAVIAVIILIGISENQSRQLPVSPGKSMMANNSSKPAAKKAEQSTQNCHHNGIELKGKVQFVDSFPDLKIKYVSSFGDIDVQFVSSFPDDCGQWQEVTSFPDFTVQVVDSFPDIEVRKVSSFPGMN